LAKTMRTYIQCLYGTYIHMYTPYIRTCIHRIYVHKLYTQYVYTVRTYIRVYGVCTVFLSGILPFMRSYTVYIYGSGQHL
jgi:hypothetical protein